MHQMPLKNSLGQFTFKQKLNLDLCYVALKLALSWELFEDSAFAVFIKVLLVLSSAIAS